jgi:hypothetical protein
MKLSAVSPEGTRKKSENSEAGGSLATSGSEKIVLAMFALYAQDPMPCLQKNCWQ